MTQMEKDIHEIAKAITKIANKDDIKEKTKADFLALYTDESSSENSNKWIPCSERLPEDDTEVLVYVFENNRSPYIAWVSDGRWYTEDFEIEREDEPVAWMPLPEPYKAEIEDKE